MFHMDFSENISMTPKFEVQEHHFNKVQSSLHCTVAYSKNGTQYFYHISDVIKHDVSFVELVVRDLISKHPDASGYIFRSDNCSTQYKCKWVFKMWQQLAVELGIIITTYYGVPGHGKGLVDSMGSFGCKEPLRKTIVTTDSDFSNASEIHEFLVDKFKDDPAKEYILLPISDFMERKDDLVIKACRKLHTIVYCPDGSIKTSRFICSCLNCSVAKFQSCVESKDLKEPDNDENDTDKEEDLDIEQYEISPEFSVEVNTNIAIHSELGSRELFKLCYITEDTKTSNTDVFDSKGHCIPAENKYITVKFYELSDMMPTNGHYVFKLLKNDVFITSDLVFRLFVDLFLLRRIIIFY